MTTHYYRYLDPINADEYITKTDHWVWYFRLNQSKAPARCTSKEDRPEDAVSAVVASPDAMFAAGEEMGLVNYTGTKDPIPPPPPPPWHASLTSYLKQPLVEGFFNGAPRDARA